MEELPKTLGRYELLEKLATGGMAHIYRARIHNASITKELVIKRVLPHLTENRDFIEMFMDEARISMPLNHGNIVQVFEFGKEGEDFFLAMEYVRGRNIEFILQRINNNNRLLPIPVALFIASEVAKGLDYAHRFRDPSHQLTGIIHRDVSPQNILVGYQGEVKLTDFGIAKAQSRIHKTTQGIIRGKAVYLSPEQASCQPLDGRSDQFSLGSVLYEMLTGKRPFEGQSEIETLDLVRRAQAPPPSTHRSEIKEQIDQIARTALALDPQQRYADCGAMQLALSKALYGYEANFTAASLASWMNENFAQEIQNENSSREHIRQQLERISSGSTNNDPTIAELMEMGTLSIAAGSNQTKASRSKSRLRALVWLGLCLIAGATWALWQVSRSQPNGFGPAQPAQQSDQQNKQVTKKPQPGQTRQPETNKRPSQQLTSHKADPPQTTKQTQDVNPDQTNAVAKATLGSDKTQVPRRPKPSFGSLNLNSRPWAYVEINGRRLKGETPVFNLKVKAGQHRLRFFNPELNIEKRMTVSVRPKENKTVSILLSE